jgi:myo-inositol catabolism protein IolC
MNSKSDSARPAEAPSSKTLVRTNAGSNDVEARSQITNVPIDEVQAIGVKVSPTYHADDIQSVTLKSFRKVVGYDTFNSILKGDRDEKKDPADYYNVTVSMMIKRSP